MIHKITTVTLAANGSSTPINVAPFENKLFAFIKVPAASTFVLKLQQSQQDTAPTFGSAASNTNPWTYLSSTDMEDPTTIIAGTTGYTYSSSGGVRFIRLNTPTSKWLSFNVSGYSAGSIDIDLYAIDEELPSTGGGSSGGGGEVTNAGTFAVQVTSIAAGNNNIGDVDVASVVPGTGATNLGKAEDAAHTTGDVGVMMLGVRRDTASALAADNDYMPFTFDSSGKLWVNIGGPQVVNVGNFAIGTYGNSDATAANLTSGLMFAENLIFNGTTWDRVRSAVNGLNSTGTGLPISALAAQFDDVSPTSITENQFGNLRMSANRNLFGTIRDAAGNERGANVDASNRLSVSVDNTVTVASHAVTNAGTFAVQVDGAALTALQLIDDTVFTDDAAFTPATSKVLAIGAIVDDTGTDSVDEGDIGAPRMSADRVLYVQGSIASGATDSGNPLKVGGRYNSTPPTLTNGQRGDMQLGTRGSLKTSLFVNDSSLPVATGADNADDAATSANADKHVFMSRNTVFDGSAWDRMYGNTGGIYTQGAIADNAADSGNPLKMGAKFNVVAPTYDDGDRTNLQSDVNGNLKVTLATQIAGESTTNDVLGVIHKKIATSTYSPSVSAIFGTDVDLSVKASAGNVFAITATNINAAVRYLQLHNKASAPANPDVPIYSIPIPAGSSTVPAMVTLGEDFFSVAGKYFSTGIAVGISTTNATFTAATTTDHNYHVHWI